MVLEALIATLAIIALLAISIGIIFGIVKWSMSDNQAIAWSGRIVGGILGFALIYGWIYSSMIGG